MRPDWQRAYFQRPGSRSRFALIPVPTPERPSAALQDTRAEITRRRGRDTEFTRQVAADAARQHGVWAAEQRERDARARWASMNDQMRAGVIEDVKRFGREPVTAMWRRMSGDPEFELPSDLKEE